MTEKPTIDAKKQSAAQKPGRSAGKARLSTSAAGPSKVGKKGAKPPIEIPSEGERYELARKAEAARIVRHSEQDRLRNKP